MPRDNNASDITYLRQNSKTVKKHKQRQGLHTAAVETAEEVRDAIGAEVVNLQARLRGPWSASRETPSSGLNDDPVGGALHQLPWCEWNSIFFNA